MSTPKKTVVAKTSRDNMSAEIACLTTPPTRKQIVEWIAGQMEIQFNGGEPNIDDLVCAAAAIKIIEGRGPAVA